MTRPITKGVFRSLKRNFIHLHTDADANFRKELLNYVTRLFDRLRGSTAAFAKAQNNKSTQGRISIVQGGTRSGKYVLAAGLPRDLAEPFEFIVWYIRFLCLELRPTSSYQRRITALKALTVILRSGVDSSVPERYLSKSAQGQLRWAHTIPITNTRLMRSLPDLILDPFDDIRSAATSILEICLESDATSQKISPLAMLPSHISRAESMMLRTGRADQADGVARAYALLFSQCTRGQSVTASVANPQHWSKIAVVGRLVDQLETTIKVAEQDLSAAVNGRPVHGIYSALR